MNAIESPPEWVLEICRHSDKAQSCFGVIVLRGRRAHLLIRSGGDLRCIGCPASPGGKLVRSGCMAALKSPENPRIGTSSRRTAGDLATGRKARWKASSCKPDASCDSVRA